MDLVHGPGPWGGPWVVHGPVHGVVHGVVHGPVYWGGPWTLVHVLYTSHGRPMMLDSKNNYLLTEKGLYSKS